MRPSYTYTIHFLDNGIRPVLKLKEREQQRSFHSLSINSSGDGGSGLRPFLFLTSATKGLNIEFGTGCHDLKNVFHIALPAVAPLIFSDKSNVSDAGISPCMMAIMPFCSTLSNLPLLPDSTLDTWPIKSCGHLISIPRMGSSSTGSAISIAPNIDLLVAGIS